MTKCLCEDKIFLFTKGNISNIENYRPINSHQFAKLSTQYIHPYSGRSPYQKIQFLPPVEQAGFIRRFSTINYMHAQRTVLEKTKQSNNRIHLVFADHIASESTEIWTLEIAEMSELTGGFQLSKVVYISPTGCFGKAIL